MKYFRIAKKFLAISLAFVMAFGVVGCKKEESGAAGETAKYVKLVMYLIAEEPRDYPEVLEKVNKKLKEKINAEIEVRWISLGDYGQKYPLLLQSGEAFDLIYTTTWTSFDSHAKKGGYMALDELLPQYAPESYEQLNKEALEGVTIDGKIYALPMNYRAVAPTGFVVRGDLMKKYGMESINNIDDFWMYLENVKKNETDIFPYNGTSADNGTLLSVYLREKGWNPGKEGRIYYRFDDINNSKYILNIPEYKDILKKMRYGYENGFWSADVLMSKNNTQVNIINGTSASALLSLKNFNAIYIETLERHPEWDLQWYQVASQYPCIIDQFSSMAVAANSKNPERALMALELLRNDEELNMLTTYGVKGKHYDIDSDNRLVLLDQDGFKADESCAWGWRNEKYYKYIANGWDKFEEVEKEVRGVAEYSPFAAFTFDDSSVKNEKSALSALYSQYGVPLGSGIVEFDEGYKTLMDNMTKAGYQKVEDAYVSQCKEFLQNK